MAAAVVTTLTAVFITLGFWQLRRHEERRAENSTAAERLAQPPRPLAELVSTTPFSELEYLPTSLSGTFHPDLEILVRNQVHLGRTGSHVLTPLETIEGLWVLVNRGWVPLEFDRPPVAAAPPAGETEVTGLIRLTQTRPGFGPVEPAGDLPIVWRVDLDRLSDQLPEPIASVWVQATSNSGAPGDFFPISAPLPEVDDPGPHFSYALQWFAFALTCAIGFGLLLRSRLSG